VVAVLGAPGVDHLDRSVRPLQRKGEMVDAGAGPDQRQQVGVVAGESGGLIEVPVDLIGEADRLGSRSSYEELGHSCLLSPVWRGSRPPMRSVWTNGAVIAFL